ncbi:MAG: putative toxin-antitoxin system toxin component, PIN family, partial [Anaerolineae bacterium]|nr:putative toxin-antitoxin system toxin component, PIN family [Anaerolineae bacterium]
MFRIQSHIPLVTTDTNVFVSGTTISDRPPSLIVQAWHEGRLQFALSEPLLAEIHDVFSRPFFTQRTGWTQQQVDAYVQTLAKGALIVPGTTAVNVCRDPKDNMVFACAVEARADFI